ncbi:MAG TPA: glycerophosphodiester phosphodiesterase family protein [Pseudolysinimonas sp.]|jgi:glycerophosphoryl diester phosphodiesterase|nr:glycerophosphodiester phosphodiesterase family protein [Pseudolysinimonas sp.]
MATTHPLARASLASALTVATVLVLVLVPQAVQAYAPSLIGPLRAPGEPAFVAGHRGDRADAPENTMPAFQAAFASGLDIVETDVQLTADGYPVLLHDPTVDRTTDGTGAVADLTLAEVEALDAGSWYAKKFAGTRIPQLGEFLDLLAATPHKRALVELKEYWTQDEIGIVLAEVYARGVQNRVVFAGFHLGTIANLGEAAPAIPRVIIRRDLPADPVGLARFYGAIAIMTTPWSLETDPDAVAEMHAAGLGVLLYTLNSVKRWREATAYGVDGIVSDKPSKLDGWLAKTAPGT